MRRLHHRSRAHRTSPLLALALLACGDSKPSVPYAVESSSAPSSSSGPTTVDGPAPSVASAFTPRDGLPAEGDGRSLVVGQRRLRPAPGRLFRRWLPLGPEAQPQVDVVVWQESPSGDRAELVIFLASGGESTPVSLPPKMELGRCKRDVELRHAAAELVTVHLRARCEGESEQWIAAVRLGGASADPELRLELRASSPLELDLTVGDRDGDGRADLLVGARHAAAPEGEPGLPLALLDRPAGYAWDPAEPEGSLTRLASALSSNGGSSDPSARARRLLELAMATCADFGPPKLLTHAGSLRCGEPSVLSDAIVELARGLARDGDLPRAALIADHLATSDPKGVALARLEAELASSLPTVTPKLRRLAAKPTSKREIHAPLSFDAEGRLLVIEERRVVQVDLGSLEESPSDALPWPRGLAWGASDATVEVAGASLSCEPARLHVETRARGSARLSKLPSISTLFPGAPSNLACRPRPLRASAALVDGPKAIVAIEGELYELGWGADGVSVKATLPPAPGAPPGMPGSARSADGRILTLALPRSVLVFEGAAAKRWRSAETSGLEACVPRADGKQVACLAGEQVVVLSHEP